MDDLRGRPFSLSTRLKDVTLLVVVAAIAALVVREIFRLDDPLFLVPIAWYTGAMVVPTLALAGAYLLSRRLPDGRSATVDRQAATIVSAWPWQWRWNVLADAGITVVTGYLFVSSLGSPEARPHAPIALLIPLIWFGMSTLLFATGRRRLDAVILTDTELIRDSINGRERIRRDTVTDVKVVVDWVFINFSGPVDRRTGPRPWRSDRKLHHSSLMIDPERLGPSPEEIVTWLRRELDLDLDTTRTTDDVSALQRMTKWFRRSS